MRWGISVPSQPPFAVGQMVAGVADSVGFESLWLWDHLLGLWHTEAHEQIALAELLPEGDAFFDPFILATALGQHWNGAIGTGVTCTTRRHPVVTAQSALSAAALPAERRVHPRRRLRRGRGDRALRLRVRPAGRAVRGGGADHPPLLRLDRAARLQGRALRDRRRSDGAATAGGQAPPADLGAAHGPRMLDICGRYCDGWLPAFPQPPEEYAARAERIRAAAREAGRPDPIMAAMFFPVSGESREKVVRDANADPLFKSVGLMISDEWLQRYAGTSHPEPGSRGIVDTVPHRYSLDAVRAFGESVRADRWVEGGWPMGNAEELTAFYRAYAEAGCEYIVIFDTTAALYGVAALEGAVGTAAQVVAAVG